MTTNVTLTTLDHGDEFDAYVARPADEPVAAIVVI